MRFADWVSSMELSWDEAARRIGVANASVAWRYAHGSIPRPAIIRHIYAVTDGRVTPNDFYQIGPVDVCEPAHIKDDFPETLGRPSTERLDEMATDSREAA